MAFPLSLVIGTQTFEQLSDGRYIDAASTADEPCYLSIDNTVNPDGVSSYVIKLTKNKNSPISGGADNVLQVHTVVKAPLKSFTQAEIESANTVLKTFLTTANFTKLLRGER